MTSHVPQGANLFPLSSNIFSERYVVFYIDLCSLSLYNDLKRNAVRLCNERMWFSADGNFKDYIRVFKQGTYSAIMHVH